MREDKDRGIPSNPSNWNQSIIVLLSHDLAGGSLVFLAQGPQFVFTFILSRQLLVKMYYNVLLGSASNLQIYSQWVFLLTWEKQILTTVISLSHNLALGGAVAKIDKNIEEDACFDAIFCCLQCNNFWFCHWFSFDKPYWFYEILIQVLPLILGN